MGWEHFEMGPKYDVHVIEKKTKNGTLALLEDNSESVKEPQKTPLLQTARSTQVCCIVIWRWSQVFKFLPVQPHNQSQEKPSWGVSTFLTRKIELELREIESEL